MDKHNEADKEKAYARIAELMDKGERTAVGPYIDDKDFDEILKIIEEYGADVLNIKGPKSGFTILMKAVDRNHNACFDSICALLNSISADEKREILNAQTPSDAGDYYAGMTALMYAFGGRDLDIAKRLLAMPEIDPNIADGRGYTALHHAVENRRGNDGVKLLLANEFVDINTTAEPNHIPALALAIVAGNVDCVDLLIKFANEKKTPIPENIIEKVQSLGKQKLQEHQKSFDSGGGQWSKDEMERVRKTLELLDAAGGSDAYRRGARPKQKSS